MNVYNSLFFLFSLLKGIRVYKNEQLVTTDISNNSVQEKVTLNENNDKLIDVFGKERNLIVIMFYLYLRMSYQVIEILMKTITIMMGYMILCLVI